MNNVIITIYRDSTGLFTREECDQDNEFFTEIPYDTLFEYFIENIKDNFPVVNVAEDITDKGLFDEWLDEYTMDETLDLYDYCKAKGVEITEYHGQKRIYGYDIWDGDKGIIIADDWVTAIEEFKENYDYPIAEIDNIDYDSGVCQMGFIGIVPKNKAKLIYMYN